MKLLVITQKVDVSDDIMGFFHGWLMHLAPHVKELHVIANAIGEQTLPENVRVYSLGKESGRSRPLRYLLFYVYLFRTLPRVDGVFIHMCPEYVKALYPLNLLLRKPVVMWYAHVAVSRTAAWAIAHVDRILSPSSDSFLAGTTKLLATGHGIDTSRFQPSESLSQNKAFQIFAASRITPIKNFEALIEVLKVLVHQHKVTNFHVTIAGSPMRTSDERYFHELKQRAATYGVSSHISWVGSIENRNLPALYQKADLFVRMQPGGGFGKTELEAMACGTPVILNTPVYNAALPDFASDMYWKEGDIEQFARNILAVMQWDQSRREAYGRAARRLVVESHNLKTLAGRIVSAFETYVRN